MFMNPVALALAPALAMPLTTYPALAMPLTTYPALAVSLTTYTALGPGTEVEGVLRLGLGAGSG